MATATATQAISAQPPVLAVGPADITAEQTLAVECTKCGAQRNEPCRGGGQHGRRFVAAADHFTAIGRSPRSFTPRRKAALALVARTIDPASRERIRHNEQDATSRRNGRVWAHDRKPWITRLHPLDPPKPCLACNRPIEPGANHAVSYDPATRTRTTYHPDCITM